VKMFTGPGELLRQPVGSGGGGVGSGPGGGIPSTGGGGIGSSGGGIGSGGRVFAAAIRPTALNLDGGVLPDANLRRTDFDALHPAMREAVLHVYRRCADEGIPFRMFEGFRTPQRQAWLYAQGRSRPGAKVTNAEPWTSCHQYGLAADFVLWLDNRWSWSTTGGHGRLWSRLHEFGGEAGLEPLSWELPHLQVADLRIADLQAGRYPDSGDDAWRDNLEAAAINWSGSPDGPSIMSARPEIA